MLIYPLRMVIFHSFLYVYQRVNVWNVSGFSWEVSGQFLGMVATCCHKKAAPKEIEQ